MRLEIAGVSESEQQRSLGLAYQEFSNREEGRYQEAIVVLEPLLKLRRSSMPWLLRAQCEELLANEAATEQALQCAVHIEPRLWRIHQKLAEIYRQRGDERRAKYHDARAVP